MKRLGLAKTEFTDNVGQLPFVAFRCLSLCAGLKEALLVIVS
jgi:hypothetical protein